MAMVSSKWKNKLSIVGRRASNLRSYFWWDPLDRNWACPVLVQLASHKPLYHARFEIV